MALFVFVRSADKERSSAAWRKTAYKRLDAWEKASGAGEHVRRLHGSALGRHCYKLPSGRLVNAQVMEEGEVRFLRELEKAYAVLPGDMADKAALTRRVNRVLERHFLARRRSGLRRT